MFKFFAYFAFISSSLAVNFQIEGWFNWNVGTVGNKWGVIVRPNEVEVSRLLNAVTANVYPVGKNSSNVEMIYIRYCHTMNYIPRGMKVFFPNFNGLHLQECGIKKLDAKDFRGYEDLQFLAIVKNKLEEIPQYLFSPIPEIQNFWAQGNQIKTIRHSALANAPNLKHVDLSNNNCTDEYALTREEVQELSNNLLSACGGYQSDNKD